MTLSLHTIECSVRKCRREGIYTKSYPWGFEFFCERHAEEEGLL